MGKNKFYKEPEKKDKAREKQLQAQIDTHRQALGDLLYEHKKLGLSGLTIYSSDFYFALERCLRLVDGSEPMPARSAAQSIDRLMQEKEALQAENEKLRHELIGFQNVLHTVVDEYTNLRYSDIMQMFNDSRSTP